MEKHKLKDFIDATKEEAGNVAVEEVLPAVVKEAGGFIVSEGVGMLASEIVGAVVHVANNIRLSYKQNRLEYIYKDSLYLKKARELVKSPVGCISCEQCVGQYYLGKSMEEDINDK